MKHLFPWILLATGCVTLDEDEVPEDEGTVEQAFTNITTFEGGGTTDTHTDLGSFADRTCFLTSVSGKFDGASLVHVYQNENTGQWRLTVDPPTGGALYARAACVGTVAGRTEEETHFPDSPTTLALLTTDHDKQCFLTAIYGGRDTLDSPTDRLNIYESAGSWYLGGTGVSGSAMCISGTKRGNGGSLIGATASILSPHLSGDQCFLTAIGGSFLSSSSTSGVRTFLDAANNRWMLSATAEKFARARCAR